MATWCFFLMEVPNLFNPYPSSLGHVGCFLSFPVLRDVMMITSIEKSFPTHQVTFFG